MKLLHVIHGLARGGLENGVVNLLNYLPKDIEQSLACLDGLGSMADRVQRNIPIHVLNRQRHDIRTPFRLARIIRGWQPDIVHCRNWNTWPDAVIAHRLAGKRGKLVWSFHGFAEETAWTLKRGIISRMLAQFSDHLFAVCRDSAKRYAKFAGINENRFGVIHNGVDCERFHPVEDKRKLRRKLELNEDERIIVTVASLTEVKDHRSLLTAAAKVLNTCELPIRFLWLGEGPLRPELETFARQLGIKNRIDMIGNSDQVPEYLACADISVLPSRLEGMSNAILEAMASGLPVVAKDVGGNPELVIEGETGFLPQDNNVTAFAAAIERLVIDLQLRVRMGKMARKHATKNFSIDSMVRNYADCYRNLTGQNG